MNEILPTKFLCNLLHGTQFYISEYILYKTHKTEKIYWWTKLEKVRTGNLSNKPNNNSVVL